MQKFLGHALKILPLGMLAICHLLSPMQIGGVELAYSAGPSSAKTSKAKKPVKKKIVVTKPKKAPTPRYRYSPKPRYVKKAVIRRAPTLPRRLPAPDRVQISVPRQGSIMLQGLPRFTATADGHMVAKGMGDQYIHVSLNKNLQSFTENLLAGLRSPHIAVVAMDPYTGKILALAQKSPTIKDLALHAGFPAASVFKLVTTAAALEHADISPDMMVPFRGGTYTLNRFNFLPNFKKDRRVMTLRDALGKSCNIVFARVASKFLTAGVLNSYAQSFGFNTPIDTDLDLARSEASIPGDPYEFGRTAAGFGDVTLSPIHAAALVSGIANGGFLPRPILVEKITNSQGTVLYKYEPHILRRIIKPETAEVLLNMMEATTTSGTSRREFFRRSGPSLPGIPVAAKTGTLSGTNPRGLNNWFVAAAPIGNPKIAISVIVVNPADHYSASRIGRMVLEEYLRR